MAVRYHPEPEVSTGVISIWALLAVLGNEHASFQVCDMPGSTCVSGAPPKPASMSKISSAPSGQDTVTRLRSRGDFEPFCTVTEKARYAFPDGLAYSPEVPRPKPLRWAVRPLVHVAVLSSATVKV